jgi:multiple sugar transport system substrate-binding protein
MTQYLNSRFPRRRWASAVAGLVTVALLAACGSQPAGAPEAASVDPGAAATATGDLMICGANNNGVYTNLVESYNGLGTGVTAQYLQLGADTNQTRTQAVQRMEGGSAECDIYMIDVVWVSELASQGWLLDQTEVMQGREGELVPSTLDTALWDDRYWATPFFTNAGLMFYRSDLVPQPTSWQQIYTASAQAPQGGIAYQAQPYEGLTVNFLELLYSAGGSVLDDQGAVTVDSPETREVLRFMASGFETGAVDRAVLTFNEDLSRRAYEAGQVAYQRNWPNVYSLLQDTELAGVSAVAPLPPFAEGGAPSGVLGGWNMAIGAASDNPAGALSVIQFATSPEFQRSMTMENSQPPVLVATYDEPEVQQVVPFASALRDAVTNAKPRPKSPVYPQISEAIYTNVYAAISGEADVDTAATRMAEGIAAAQDTF